MSTTATFAAVAAAQSAQAASDAAEALCIVKMQSFQPTNAGTREMQEYANCVDRLYPQYSDGDVLTWKIIVALSIVLFVVSAIWGSVNDGLEGFFLWALGALLFSGIAIAIFFGLRFVFF